MSNCVWVSSLAHLSYRWVYLWIVYTHITHTYRDFDQRAQQTMASWAMFSMEWIKFFIMQNESVCDKFPTMIDNKIHHNSWNRFLPWFICVCVCVRRRLRFLLISSWRIVYSGKNRVSAQSRHCAGYHGSLFDYFIFRRLHNNRCTKITRKF